MRSFRLVLLALLVSPIPLPASAPPAYPFQDPKLPARERAADLVARMSDEEKVRQMDMWQGDDFTTAGALDAEKTKAVLAGQGLGAVHYLFPSPALANAFQRLVMTDSRWGIPALVSEEMLHGYTARGSTSYPMPLAPHCCREGRQVFRPQFAFSHLHRRNVVAAAGLAVPDEVFGHRGDRQGVAPALTLQSPDHRQAERRGQI